MSNVLMRITKGDNTFKILKKAPGEGTAYGSDMFRYVAEQELPLKPSELMKWGIFRVRGMK